MATSHDPQIATPNSKSKLCRIPSTPNSKSHVHLRTDSHYATFPAPSPAGPPELEPASRAPELQPPELEPAMCPATGSSKHL